MARPKASGSGALRLRSLALFERQAAIAGEPRSVVLLTGFGPFPGVDYNPSADLAVALAELSRRRHTEFRFIAEVLPVDWSKAPMRLADLLQRHAPAMALHFGVSERASGFVIESHAYNATKELPDEAGELARSAVLVAGDRPRRAATLPVRRLVRSLQKEGFPAELSSDPGRYLCNAVLYHSLRHAARTAPRTRTGFIHIPASLEPGGGTGSPLQWAEALAGGLKLIQASLATLREQKSVLS